MIYIKIDEFNKVSFIHNMPLDPIYGLHETKEELLKTGYFINSIPDPIISVGKSPILYYDPTTKLFSYQYEDVIGIETPESKISILETKVAELQSTIDTLLGGVTP